LKTDHFQLGGVTGAAPLGTTSVSEVGSSIGGVINSTGTRYTFPASITSGNYLILYSVFGTAAAITNPAFTAHNASFLTIWNNIGNNSLIITNGTTTPLLITGVILQITSSSAYVAVGTAGTLPTTVTAGDFWVTQVNENIETKSPSSSLTSEKAKEKQFSLADLKGLREWCEKMGIVDLELGLRKFTQFMDD